VGKHGQRLGTVRRQIMGFVVVPKLGGILGFSGVSGTIGSKDVPDVQNYLQNRLPGDLVLKLNGLSKANDPMETFGVVSTPGKVACPVGTVPI